MNRNRIFRRERAAAALHSNDYAQMLTLAERVRFERSLVEDLLDSDLIQYKKRVEAREDFLVFFREDVQRLSQHEQRMLDNFAQLIDHNRMEYLVNDQDL